MMSGKLQIILVSIIFSSISSQYVDFLTKSRTCPNENMIFMPMDENSTSWICDCLMKYLYYSETDSCYEPYKQGPCEPGNYLVFSPEYNSGVCENNPCSEDGLVPFGGRCHPLGKFESHCSKKNYTVVMVTLNFKLVCSPPINFGIIGAPHKICPTGSRRIAKGICKQVLQ